MVMRQMRDNTKWIMLATALAFVVLMVFQWGMDITGRTSGSLGEIGRVNGDAVQYEQYMSTYRRLFELTQGQQAEPISSLQNRQLEDAAWDQVVDQILIRQELSRRGIDVTDEEIRQAARFTPPPEMRSSPAFQDANGQFDINKYQQYLENSADPVFFEQLEAYYRDMLPQGKLMRQLSTGVFVTDADLWGRFKDGNERVTVRYVAFDPTVRVPDDSVSITEREIENYWDENQDDFERPASASVRIIALPRVISVADTVAARDRASALLAELRTGASIDSVGAREAVAERPAIFEDLGTFGRADMAPAFDSAAFAARVGQPTGPVLTQFGYHVLVASARTADSVTAKHILVPITRTDDSEVRLLTLADSMETLVEDRTLEEAAQNLGLVAPQTVEVSEAFPFATGAGQVDEGLEWALQDAVPGDVSEVFESDQAYYAMELISSRPSGVLPLDEAEPTIREVLLTQKKIEKARAEAERLVERVRSGATLDAAATELGLGVSEAGPFTRQDFVPGLGQVNPAIGAAFGLAQGETSGPVATEQNVFVIEKLAHTPADSAAWLAQKGMQRLQVTAILQQQRVQEWIAGLRAEADIVDRREEVLQPTDSISPLSPYMPF
jgi:parvulin-like peptidyl-prolyl isomerase